MNENNRMNTFLELSGLSGDKGFRERIIKQVLDWCKESDSKLAKEFLKYRRSLKTRGFRPGKAPENIVVREFCNFDQSKPVFLDLIFLIWWEINSDFFDSVAAFLENKEEGVVETLENELIDNKNDEILSAVVSEFLSENPETPAENAKLALSYLILLTDTSEDEDSETEDELTGNEVASDTISPMWQDTLHKMSQTPPDAKEWDDFDLFIKEASRVRDEKLSEKESIQKTGELQDILDDILKMDSDFLDFLEIGSMRSWRAENILPENRKETSASLKELKNEILAHQRLDIKTEKKGKTYKEERERRKRREGLGDIEDNIQRIYDNLSKQFEAAPEEEEDETQLDTDEVKPPVDAADIDESTSDADGIDDDLTEDEADVEVDTEDVTVEPELTDVSAEVDTKGPEEDVEEKKVEADHVKPTDKVDLAEPCYYTTRSTSQEIAHDIMLNKQIDSKSPALTELIWSLIIENKLSPAFWVANLAVELDEVRQQTIPPWLIKALAIANNLKHNFGPLSPKLELLTKEEFNESIFEGSVEWRNGISLLLSAAMLRPSVLSPQSGASGILRSSKSVGGLHKTFEIINAFADFGDRGHAVNLGTLGSLSSEAEWNEELTSLIDLSKSWFEQAPQTPFIFAPSAKVWRKLLRKGELIYELLNPVRRNFKSKVGQVRSLVEKYSSESNLKILIGEVDRRIRQKRSGKMKITGKGLNQLIGRTEEAIEMARDWVTLYEQKPDKNKNWIVEQTKRLIDSLVMNYDWSLEELDAMSDAHQNSWPIKGGAFTLRSAITDVRRLFEASDVPGEEPSAEMILNADLLQLPSVRLNEELVPISYSKRLIAQEMIELLAEGGDSWEHFVDLYCQAKDHEKTLQIVDYLRQTESDVSLDELEEKRSQSVNECVENLEILINKTNLEIGNAITDDLLSEQEISKYNNEIDLIEPSKVLYFPEYIERLENVIKEIDSKRKKRIKDIKTRLEKLSTDESAKARITSLIDAGDIATADEFIVLLKQGEALPDVSETDDEFDWFFSTFRKDLEIFREGRSGPPPPNNNKIVRFIERGQSFGPVKLRDIRGAQLKEAAQTMKAWFTAKRAKKINHNQLSNLLNWLGFEVKTCSAFEKAPDRIWFHLNTKIVRQCPIPSYGSEADGQYTALCVFSRPSEESILDWTSKHRTKGIPIVFYFGRMTAHQWRHLAIESKRKSPGTVLVDETILFLLVSERGFKLPKLFKYTLPFTNFNPYMPFATGNVHQEMFYGRHKEKKELTNPHGACIVYGGRQLGKSALLRSVARDFHRPDDNHYALFVDLKTEGIGETRPVDDLWLILSKRLKRFGIISHETPEILQGSEFAKHVLAWTGKGKRRRLLLLLDEADLLLDDDARRNFVRINLLKGLMENSNRRVKLVLAGLHNVQRFASISNQPLAHLGEPICVGPLLGEGEWREAKALIEKPLNALGYRFEKPDLVNRILAHTNYQPSLIQLFCDTLVRHLTDSNKVIFDVKSSPPYLIEEKYIDDVYSNTNLRKNIRDRFELTLNLDPRYKIIAYSVASAATEDDETYRYGFDVSWFTKETFHWWAKGFADCNSLDDMRALLDEMVGLGVLSRTPTNTYHLRSPNVRRLLGSPEEIEHTLLAAESLELPKKFESSVFRRVGKPDQIKRSPITGSQESDLLYRAHGVRLIFGSQALGIDDVPKFLKQTKSEVTRIHFKTLPSSTVAQSDFESSLNKFVENKEEGLNIFIVPSNTPFSEKWVESSLSKLSRLKSKRAIVRINFLFEPNAMLSWLKLPEGRRTEISQRGALPVYLKCWSETTLQRWLDDLEIPPNSPEQRQQIFQETGGWPSLLYKFASFCIKDLFNWKQALEKLNSTFKSETDREQFLLSVGLVKGSAVRKVLHTWADIFGEPLSLEDVITLTDFFPADETETYIEYGKALGLITQTEDDTLKITTIIHKLIQF